MNQSFAVHFMKGSLGPAVNPRAAARKLSHFDTIIDESDRQVSSVAVLLGAIADFVSSLKLIDWPTYPQLFVKGEVSTSSKGW